MRQTDVSGRERGTEQKKGSPPQLEYMLAQPPDIYSIYIYSMVWNVEAKRHRHLGRTGMYGCTEVGELNRLTR